MKQKRLFDRSPVRSGLVIVFPPGITSLFNPRVHRLVSEAEDQLDGVFVTYALSGGALPDIDAALKAARFAGCASAVVIQTDDWFCANGLNSSTTGVVWSDDILGVELRESVDLVVRAYNQARAVSGLAA